jgi:flavin reductase (DIM6/NTAB) family NADH-FMN oxidoreductase RutF
MEPAVINALEPREFRRVLGHFATGVTVVTAEHDGKPFGATISAFSALSAEPPTILVCLNQNLGTHDSKALLWARFAGYGMV